MKELIKKAIDACTPRSLYNYYIQKFKEKAGIENGHYLISFSQQAEDLHIQRILGDKPNGFYVDIGAYHPFQYSNTQLFYSKGWRGINIEPNPENFKLFEECRPADINLNIAVSDTMEELTYYQFNTPAINSFSKSHADDWAARPGHFLTGTTSIQCQPLSFILQSHLPQNTCIDFMNIDVEGMDLEVLQSNNWGKFRPRLLLVEASFDTATLLSEHPIVHFLQTKGYKLECITGGTFLFLSA